MSEQRDIAELERRITAALGRIDAGLDKWDPKPTIVAAEAAAVQPVAEAVAPAAEKSAEEKPAAEPVAEPAEKPAEDAAQLAESIAMIAELETEVARLKTALAAEKATVAQLTERAKAVKEPVIPAQTQVDAKVEKMTQQLDIQGLELQRMRKSSVQLRENLRVLQEAATKNMVEPQLINKVMLAELENLRATRHTETAEMDEILAELKPLIAEARHNG
jgi:hypothetical protein